MSVVSLKRSSGTAGNCSADWETKLLCSSSSTSPSPLQVPTKAPTQSFVRLSQRNLGLPSSEWDHDYCRVFTRNTQFGSRSSVTVSNGFQQMTNEGILIFKEICKVFWTPDIELFASRIPHQVPVYLAWKPDPFSKRTDAFQLSWRNLKGYSFPLSLLSHRTGFEKTSSEKWDNNFNNRHFK